MPTRVNSTTADPLSSVLLVGWSHDASRAQGPVTPSSASLNNDLSLSSATTHSAVTSPAVMIVTRTQPGHVASVPAVVHDPGVDEQSGPGQSGQGSSDDCAELVHLVSPSSPGSLPGCSARPRGREIGAGCGRVVLVVQMVQLAKLNP